MAIIKEISDSEAAEILGNKVSQERALEQESENERTADLNREGVSQGSALDELLRRISDLEGVLPQEDGTSGTSDRPSAHSNLHKRARSQSAAEVAVGGRESKVKKTGAGEAVLLGALATGVNGPTWFVIKVVLVALAASLVLLLHVAIRSSSVLVLVNVLFLIIIAGGLALLLIWFISQTGLVTVEKQMAELNLTDGAPQGSSKTE